MKIGIDLITPPGTLVITPQTQEDHTNCVSVASVLNNNGLAGQLGFGETLMIPLQLEPNPKGE